MHLPLPYGPPTTADSAGGLYLHRSGVRIRLERVTLGPDLVWRGGRFVTVRGSNRDPDFRNPKTLPDNRFNILVRHVYKVLLTRGMIGTVIYSTDRETREALRSLFGSHPAADIRSMDVPRQGAETATVDDRASSGL